MNRLRGKTVYTDTADALVVIKTCRRGLGRQLYNTIASLIREGAYKFALRLEGSSFEECLDEIRDVVQGFIASSFMVVDESYDVKAKRTIVVD